MVKSTSASKKKAASPAKRSTTTRSKATVRTGVRGSVKKRKKRKAAPTREDGARAALLAAFLVGLTVIVSVVLLIFFRRPDDASRHMTEVPVSSGTVSAAPESSPPLADTPVLKYPDPVTRKVPADNNPYPEQVPPSPPDAVPETIPESLPLLPVQPAAIPEKIPEPVPEQGPVLSIVIDDAGNNLYELDPFLSFPGPLSIAVLPGLPHSAEAARRIRAAGKEVLLHQPMEALGGQDPGPGGIYTGMSDAEIYAVLKKNLAEVGPVAGMNNHQGSKITMDTRIMQIVLAFCEEHDIYFLDSRTTADSVVPAVAAGMGIHIRERDVFVDNIQEKAAMIRYIQEGMRKAESKGSAVMIGHTWSSELAATLEELYPELIEQGFSLSTISKIMMGTWEDEGPWY